MKSLKIFLLLFSLSLFLTGCASFNNASGAKALGDNPAIVSTSVAICEILDALNYDNITGVPETSKTLPTRYAKAEIIGIPMTPDYEKIKSIPHDLVLSPKTLEDSLSKNFSAAGINSAFLDLSSVEGMYKAIDSLGELLNRKAEAKKLIEDYKSYLQDYKADTAKEAKVMILMSFPDGFYLVATENSYVGNLVKLAGAKNTYDSSYSGDENGFININPEDMVQKKPDKILVFAHYAENDAFAFMKKEFSQNSKWQHYEAVKNEEIYYLPSELFGMSATLSWMDALDYLKPVLYGKAK